MSKIIEAASHAGAAILHYNGSRASAVRRLNEQGRIRYRMSQNWIAVSLPDYELPSREQIRRAQPEIRKRDIITLSSLPEEARCKECGGRLDAEGGSDPDFCSPECSYAAWLPQERAQREWAEDHPSPSDPR